MKICIKRGTHQVGGSCVEIAAANGKKIMIDLGMPLSEEFLTPSPEFMPDVETENLQALLISHPHGDHYMLVPFLEKRVPIYIGRAAAAIIEAANSYMKDKVNLPDTIAIENKKSFMISDTFKITPFLTDHSAYDAYMFLIEADGKRVLYTGDFRQHGRKAKLVEDMRQNPPSNIDVMLCEGTNIRPPKTEEIGETDGSHIPEEVLEHDFEHEFTEAKGLVAVQSSCQNIDRLVTIYKAAKHTKRELVLPWNAGYILMAIDNPHLPNFTWKDVKKFKMNPEKSHEVGLTELAAHPEKYVVFLTGGITQALLKNGLFNSDSVYIWSLWHGYKRQEYSKNMLTAIADTGAKIPPDIHVSGHAHWTTIVDFVDAMNPKRLIPIHTDNPDMFKDMEWQSGFTGKIEIHNDNEWWEV